MKTLYRETKEKLIQLEKDKDNGVCLPFYETNKQTLNNILKSIEGFYNEQKSEIQAIGKRIK